jgi:hypothetical protein
MAAVHAMRDAFGVRVSKAETPFSDAAFLRLLPHISLHRAVHGRACGLHDEPQTGDVLYSAHTRFRVTCAVHPGRPRDTKHGGCARHARRLWRSREQGGNPVFRRRVPAASAAYFTTSSGTWAGVWTSRRAANRGRALQCAYPLRVGRGRMRFWGNSLAPTGWTSVREL